MPKLEYTKASAYFIHEIIDHQCEMDLASIPGAYKRRKPWKKNN